MKEENRNGNVRQVSLSRMNESVFLISTDKSESMDHLIKTALSTLRKMEKR